ncbi:MAG: phosphofructokinase [Microbacteriaceae bacterium]|nr:phosphofructokinase [Microbacteriaceae bacterium]
MTDVTIFAPSPILTVTVEDHPAGDEIHVHAGGQGVWQARMLRRLGSTVTMCCVLSGETGAVLRHLLEDEGVTVDAIERAGRGAAYLHDRRSGERRSVAEEPGEPLGRHDLDELYGRVLRSALDSSVTILSGPADASALPPDTYRRLAADLRAAGTAVAADLAGERLVAAVDGGLRLLKVSDEELLADGLLGTGRARSEGDERPEVGAVAAAMRALRDRGAQTVIVTRSSEPLLLLDEQGLVEVAPPKLEAADPRGAGDSLFAGTVSGLARGESIRQAVTLGAAAGALNVTRHGLGSGDAEAVERLRRTVAVRELVDAAGSPGPGVAAPPPPSGFPPADRPVSGRVSPEGLASLAVPATGPVPVTGPAPLVGEPEPEPAP